MIMAVHDTPLIKRQAWVAGSEGLEKTQLDLGFIPLSDCAPLVIAHEKGFFERHGLQVTLHRERSWASIRDKTIFGVFDAAHMLYPMPIALTLGVAGPVEPMVTALCLNLGGNAITVSNDLHRAMQEAAPELMQDRASSATALRKLIEQRKAERAGPLTFGVVFPTSTHHYELRFWMASAGIDPDQDVKLMVVPPPEMPAALREGRLDGYCVGEPWNSFAVSRGWGKTLITKHELWNHGPEKVLGVTERWARHNPSTHNALVRAVLEACVWIDLPENRAETSAIIAQPHYVDAPEEVVKMSMLGRYHYDINRPAENHPGFVGFHHHAANFPWKSHAVWFMTQMLRWGQLEPPADFTATADRVMRTDVYRLAAAELGVGAPAVDYKTEGTHAGPWVLETASNPIAMSSDRMLDGRSFDPKVPLAYLDTLRAGSTLPDTTRAK